MTTARRSHLMHGALELLRDGVAPRDAALSAGVTLQALYRAMRAEGIGNRCPTCGKLETRDKKSTALEPAVMYFPNDVELGSDQSNRETLDAGYSAPVEPGLEPLSNSGHSTD